MTNQSIEWESGDLVTLPWPITSTRYPNGTVFAYKFQVTLKGVAVLNKTGTATVAGLSFDVDLSTTDTALAVDQYDFSLRDTTNNITLAKGTVTVNAGQV